jgi:hypothetical protein
VDGNEVTVTFHNTTLKIQLQGSAQILHNFCYDIFVPFLDRRVREERRVIDDINLKMLTFVESNVKTRGQKRSILSLKTTPKLTPQKRRNPPNTQKKQRKKILAIMNEVQSEISDDDEGQHSGGMEI